jgi:hypothetical protein
MFDDISSPLGNTDNPKSISDCSTFVFSREKLVPFGSGELVNISSHDTEALYRRSWAPFDDKAA